MNTDITKTIKNTLILTVFFTIMLIITSVVFLRYNEISSPVTEGISLVGNYVGGITTLSAAYIAYLIYSGWKTVEEFKTIQILHSESVDTLKDCMKELNRIKGGLIIIQITKQKGELSDDIHKNLMSDLKDTTIEVFTCVQERTFSMCVKIAMAYTNPLKSDAELNYMFETLTGIKAFVDKIISEGTIEDETYKEIMEYINYLSLNLDNKTREKNAK